MISENPDLNSIESINKLEKMGHKIIFVSKCKQNFRVFLKSWLSDYNLNNDVYFCNEYSEKNMICELTKVDLLIDDKLQVFKEMPDTITKIWLCSDLKKISGENKYQSAEVSKVRICGNWEEILDYFIS
jgi:uncharacterized HAD superfamily protein